MTKTTKESKTEEPVNLDPSIRVTMTDGAVHEIPLMHPLFTLFITRAVRGSSDGEETFGERCIAAHEYLRYREVDGIPEDFLEFVASSESISLVVGDTPLDKIPELMLEETQSNDSQKTSSTEG